jgi:hypothetical protein
MGLECQTARYCIAIDSMCQLACSAVHHAATKMHCLQQDNAYCYMQVGMTFEKDCCKYMQLASACPPVPGGPNSTKGAATPPPLSSAATASRCCRLSDTPPLSCKDDATATTCAKTCHQHAAGRCDQMQGVPVPSVARPLSASACRAE